MLTAEQYLHPAVAARVRRLDLRAKFIVEGFLAGLHDSPYRGFSAEFSEHRRYAAGDDPADLDWTVWARTDRLFVRTFRAETNLAAYLVVDVSRSMAWAGWQGGMTKQQYATALAAALAYLLVRQGDAVGLAAVGRGLTKFLRPRGGRRQLARILAHLAADRAAGGTDLAAGLHALARRVRRRSLMLILSDLLDDPPAVLTGMAHLAHRGHDLVVFHILDAAERNLDVRGPVVLEDPETGALVETDADAIRSVYRRRVAHLAGQYERGVRRLRGDFVALTTSTPFDVALVGFLRQRKRRM